MTKRLLAGLIHKASGICFCHLFLGAITSPAVTSSKETWQLSRCVCHVCTRLAVWWSVFAYLLLCRYQSVGASWGDRRRHYLGNVHDHQPAGQQVRDSHWGSAVCFLGCSLLIFQSIAPHLSSLFLPRCCLLSLPNMHHKDAQIDTEILWKGNYTVTSTHTSICRHISTLHGVFAHLADTTGKDMMCHKYIGSCRQIALLP